MCANVSERLELSEGRRKIKREIETLKQLLQTCSFSSPPPPPPPIPALRVLQKTFLRRSTELLSSIVTRTCFDSAVSSSSALSESVNRVYQWLSLCLWYWGSDSQHAHTYTHTPFQLRLCLYLLFPVHLNWHFITTLIPCSHLSPISKIPLQWDENL